MKRILTVAAGLIGATLMLGAGAAHAGVNAQIHIGVPGVYVQPAPVYVQPQPVFVQPRPVYSESRRYYHVQPQPVYVERHHHRGWREHERRGHRDHRDNDRDGRPNYADRDRDGDGVPNRFDNRPNNPRRY